ncbi:MAG: ATP-dependent DNA helicase RecG, partial [bacterium]
MRQLGNIDIQYVKGIGEYRAKLLRAHNIETLEDLIYFFPRRYLDRSTVTPIRELREGDETTVVGKIVSSQVQTGRKNRLVILVGDGTGFMQCVWFNMINFWKKQFEIGESVSFSGKVGYFKGFQMAHPEFDKLDEAGDWQTINTGMIVPMYSSTEALSKAGFTSKGFRRLLHKTLANYEELITETLPDDLICKNQLVSLRKALKQIHYPASDVELAEARKRLKFDELFFLELMLALRRKNYREMANGISFQEVGDRTRRLIENLGFELTTAQRRVLREIWADMKSAQPMNRLVQGDVGSGKTIVGLIAMLMAVENGYQAAMMAPTEILAEQHYLTTHKLLEAVDVPVKLLIGGLAKKAREQALAEIAGGEAKVVVGTHALIQPDVAYDNLGMAIVDEQHRFGVMQRAALKQKGKQPDLLVMTATPIPRTLSMTLYGDLDVSIIDELPAGRKPIRTVDRSSTKRKDVYHYVRD